MYTRGLGGYARYVHPGYVGKCTPWVYASHPPFVGVPTTHPAALLLAVVPVPHGLVCGFYTFSRRVEEKRPLMPGRVPLSLPE